MHRRVLFHFLLLCSCSLFSEQTVVYQASQEGKDQKTTWVVEEGSDQIDISGQNRGNAVKLEYSPSFDLLHYVEKDQKNDPFEVHRDGMILSVKNNAKSKTLKLNNLPWIQEFKFGFQSFLRSAEQELAFCIVYNKDTTLHDMVATKEKIEKVTVGEKTYDAQKLRITLKGFKKRFWKAEAWFDTKTNLMVKYKSNEGPGTPLVEVTLLASQDKEIPI